MPARNADNVSVYTGHDVKTRAVTIFLTLISNGNKSLGDKLTKHREAIHEKALHHIQQIGIHEYADRVLKDRHSQRERGDLEFFIDENVS